MILNVITNMFYIGSAVHFGYRKKKHIDNLNSQRHHSIHLQHAWNKYWGERNFEFHIIEYVENKAKLLEREQWWFDLTHCWKRSIGYNICPTAGSLLGTTQTKEHIEKRNKNRDFVVTEETKAKISATLKGRPISEEAKTKMSASRKGKQYRLGTITSEETKKKLSEAGKGRKQSAESIEKTAAAKRGKPRSEETKAKIRETLIKNNWKKKFPNSNWVN